MATALEAAALEVATAARYHDPWRATKSTPVKYNGHTHLGGGTGGNAQFLVR